MSTDIDTAERELFITDMRDRLWKCPNGQYAVQAGYMLAGFGVHRDSDSVERTNWAEAQRLICEAVGQEWTAVDDLECFSISGDAIYTDAVMYGSWGHWAVGWVQELLIRSDNDTAIDKAFELWKYVHRDYPILNDELWSEIEWDDNHPDDGYCYADDCECGEEKA